MDEGHVTGKPATIARFCTAVHIKNIALIICGTSKYDAVHIIIMLLLTRQLVDKHTMSYPLVNLHIWLVVSIPPKNMKVNWDDYSQSMGK